MPFVSDQQLAEIRSRADIVQVVGERVPLKRAGRNFKGACPFHQEKSPSFMVHPEKQIYHCFGCGAGGDVFSFLMKFEGVDFVEAVENLAERYGVVIERLGADAAQAIARKAEKDNLLKINRLALRFFYDALQAPEGTRGLSYLTQRSIRPEMIKEAYLGFAPGEGRALTQRLREKQVPLELAEKLGLIRRGSGGEYYDFFRDRLMFTVASPDGKILGFSGRVMEAEAQPKYLNSPESPIYHKSDSLLGIHMAREAIREADQVILVEGNFDMIRLHQEGIKNVVAPLGTALTESQVRYLRRFTDNFVLLFDGDTAGQKAAERALEIFLPLGLSPKVVVLPEGEDPDTFVQKNGAEPLRKMLSQSPSLLEVRIERILSTGTQDPQVQAKAIRGVAELLTKLPGEVEKRLYIQRVAGRFGIQEDVLWGLVLPHRGNGRKESNFSRSNGDHGGRSFPPIERTLLEVLLSGHVNPRILLEAIEAKDFSHPELSEIWEAVDKDFEEHGMIETVRLLERFASAEKEGLRRLLTELAFAGSRWKETGGQVAEDCLKQLRMGRLRAQLKDLSHRIRRAETEHDAHRVEELIEEKNRLMKEMMSLH